MTTDFAQITPMMDEIVQVPEGHRLAIRALSASRSGTNGRWPQKRRWTERVVNPLLCIRGWHACLNTRQIVDGGWFDERFWLVELAGDIIVGDDNVAAERARLIHRLPWDGQVARLWACDVAEHVLPIFERECPNDDRPRQAIETARAFARGEVSDAVRDAAWAAADAAAWAVSDTARAAAWAASDTAMDTAWAAAGRAAAWAADRDAERDWQAHHLAVVLGLGGTTLDGGNDD